MFIRRDNELEVVPGNTKDVIGKLEPSLYTVHITKNPFTGTRVMLEPNTRYRDATLLGTGTFKKAVDLNLEQVKPS